MKLIFDHRMLHHINQVSLKESGHASGVMLLIERLLKVKYLYYPLGVAEHIISFILSLPIPLYSSIIYWMITHLRGLPHIFGMYVRALYYRRILGSMASNVFIDQNVFFAHPEAVHLAEFSYIDKNVIIMSKTAKIGKRVHLAPRVFISGGGDFEIDDYAGIAPNANIITATEVLKDGARFGPMVNPANRNVYRGRVHIMRDAFIGTNVTILPGVTVAQGSVVGAGVTLLKNTEEWKIYMNPFPYQIAVREKVRWDDD